MNETIFDQQSKLPKSIRLFRYNPDREPFSWESWNPEKVKGVEDLPSYLILGQLDKDSFELSSDGWTATWQGAEPDIRFEVKYLAEKKCYDVQQTWCGIDGGSCHYLSTVCSCSLWSRFRYFT